MHLYWYVDCKKPECKKRLVLKHVEYGPTEEEIGAKILPLELRCEFCGALYTYTMDDLRDYESEEEEDLPPGFSDKF
jgi:hypothetical protein